MSRMRTIHFTTASASLLLNPIAPFLAKTLTLALYHPLLCRSLRRVVAGFAKPGQIGFSGGSPTRIPPL